MTISDAPKSSPSPRSSPTLLPAIAVGLLLFIAFVFVAGPAVDMGSREAARRMQCSNNLHNIAIALQNYHDDHGSFPPAYIAAADGKPMHSWRVLLLPYLDREDLYAKYRFDEPWDGPNNSQLHGQALKVFLCSSS